MKVTLKTLELAINKGFIQNKKTIVLHGSRKGPIESIRDIIPTQSDIQTWLRDTFLIDIDITTCGNVKKDRNGYLYEISGNEQVSFHLTVYEKYESALEKALIQAIEEFIK